MTQMTTPLDIEQALPPLSLSLTVKEEHDDEEDDHPQPPQNTVMMNDEDNDGNDDSVSQPGTLVVHEELEPDNMNGGRCGWWLSSFLRSKKENTTFWCLAVVTVLIIAAGTLTAVVLRISMIQHRTNTSSSSSPPSSSNNNPMTESYYQERYEIFLQTLLDTFERNMDDGSFTSISALLTTPDTPQYQAFQWMVYEDTTIVSSQNASSEDTPILVTLFLQRYTIMVLYYACGGEAWQIDSATSSTTTTTATNSNNMAGLGHIDTCEWGHTLKDPDFIVCDTTTKEIIQLQLDQKRLIGQLPNELVILSSLMTLDVSFNFLKGTIPTNLFQQMIQLQTLRLNNNEFVGPLPISIGQLVSLQEMTLGYNYFTGSIPMEYASLIELQKFHAKDVPSLQGSFFSVFGTQWTKLQYLILDGTALTGTIPSNVMESWSDSMIDLELGNSMFSGTFPTEIGTCTHLTNLNSIGNHMYGQFPNVTSLTNLKYLTIQGSDITGTIPTEIGKLTELLELSIRFTGINGTIPTEIGFNTKLELFTITNTNITGPIPMELINNVPTLSLITLKENVGLDGSSIPDTVCPYIQSGLLHLSISCNIECSCCIDRCTTTSTNGELLM